MPFGSKRYQLRSLLNFFLSEDKARAEAAEEGRLLPSQWQKWDGWGASMVSDSLSLETSVLLLKSSSTTVRHSSDGSFMKLESRVVKEAE